MWNICSFSSCIQVQSQKNKEKLTSFNNEWSRSFWYSFFKHTNLNNLFFACIIQLIVRRMEIKWIKHLDIQHSPIITSCFLVQTSQLLNHRVLPESASWYESNVTVWTIRWGCLRCTWMAYRLISVSFSLCS